MTSNSPTSNQSGDVSNDDESPRELGGWHDTLALVGDRRIDALARGGLARQRAKVGADCCDIRQVMAESCKRGDDATDPSARCTSQGIKRVDPHLG